MKLNNKGFALTSIIYMLIVLFLMVMLLILANLAQRKVVLDKIKNDVKENLNQGGVVASSNMIVTFDPQGGQINQTSKQVTYNEPYGELPTPTKEGYKFIGWTSKNLAPEINDGNYTFYHHASRTSSEFRTEDGINYIRINGNPSTTNIDTLWNIYTINKIKLYQGEYTLSFDVRSSVKQYISKKNNASDGKTGIYVNNTTNINNMISNIENDYIFDNDGEWHHFTSKITIPYYTENALIVIGNDVPNIYGTNSYLDIKNIQLERGNTGTEYEPYQEYTKDTIVTRGKNHTLYAMWEPLYTVTFDANGGTLSETTKEVSYHEPYGSLPTPTREGYSFLGWNGKNMFNSEQAKFGYISDADGVLKDTQNGRNSSDFIEIKADTDYTISPIISSGKWGAFYDQNKNYISGFTYTNGVVHSPSTAKYIRFTVNYSNSNDSYETTTQFEEGSIATEYEPYYITSETTVVQENNHTLKAIWEPNE